MGDNRCPLGQVLPAPSCSEHDTSELAIGVLKAKVEMPGLRLRQVGDLTAYPEVGDQGVALKQIAQVSCYLAHSIDVHKLTDLSKKRCR